MSAIQKAINSAGSQSELARKLGISQQRLSNWKLPDRRVPPEFCIPIELAVDGAVTRYELRPDIFRPDAAA